MLWLNGTVLPLNTEEDWYLCERSEDSAKNTTEIFIFFSTESFYITWNCFWMTAHKISNNFLQISCCEFEYLSINKRYTSKRRQRNETTKSQNERARISSAVIRENIDIHNRVRTPEKCSPRIYLPFSKQSIGATARGSTSLVWQLLSFGSVNLN